MKQVDAARSRCDPSVRSEGGEMRVQSLIGSSHSVESLEQHLSATGMREQLRQCRIEA